MSGTSNPLARTLIVHNDPWGTHKMAVEKAHQAHLHASAYHYCTLQWSPTDQFKCVSNLLPCPNQAWRLLCEQLLVTVRKQKLLYFISKNSQVYNIRISIWPIFNTKKHFHHPHESNDGAPAFCLSWSLRNFHQAYAHYVKEHRLIVNCGHKHSNSFHTLCIQTWRQLSRGAKGEKQNQGTKVSFLFIQRIFCIH
jgi:hypothetical protein